MHAWDLYRSGDIEGAREVYRRTLARETDELWHGRVLGRRTPKSLVGLWETRLVACLLPLTGWTTMEGWLRVNRGAQTPPDVAREIALHALDLAAYGEAFSASAEAILTPEDTRGLLYKETAELNLGKTIFKILGLLRDTGMEDARAELLRVARKYRDLPETLAEFDAQYPNAAEIMDVRPEPTPAPPPPPSPWTELESDHPIVVLVTDYYRALYSGDLPTLRSLMVDGYWPEDRMLAAIDRLADGSFVNIGTVRVRDIGNNEFEVWTTDDISVNAQGAQRQWDDKVIVKRIPEGEFRIVYTRSEASRNAWKEVEGR